MHMCETWVILTLHGSGRLNYICRVQHMNTLTVTTTDTLILLIRKYSPTTVSSPDVKKGAQEMLMLLFPALL